MKGMGGEERERSERLGRLVGDYGERAFRFAYRLTGNVEEAKELVQEAYRRVLERWDRYDPDQPLENWFFVVLRHLFLDHVRRRERGRAVSLDAPLHPGEPGTECVADRLADGEQGALEALEREDGRRAVRRALDGLQPDYRAAVTLCDMEGLAYARIAEVLGCPVGTVRSRVSRARLALRTALAGEMGMEGKQP